MLDEKGFSLVEVIICIAIMGILSVSAFSLSNHVKYADAKRCAKVLNQKIEVARMRSLSKKGDWHLYIYADGSSICYEVSDKDTVDKSKGEKLGGGNIDVFFTSRTKGTAGPGTETQITGSVVVDMQFYKSTGAFRENSSNILYDSIRVKEREGLEYVIELVEKTGKHNIA